VNNYDVSHSGDATLLRKVNESAILELIQEHGPISRTEVAGRLGLSLTTVTRIVSLLIDHGLIYVHSSADSSGGRRPILLDFNYRASLIIGVYIQRNMVGALADLNGTILHRASAPSQQGEAGIQVLVGLIGELRRKADALGLPVRGVGVGAPSIVTQPDGFITWAPVLAWRDVPLRRRLEEALGLPVVVQNEINLLALGENWRGAGRGIDNLACISLGAGVGAGLVVNGQVYNGAHYAAGEIGYLVPGERFLGRTYDTFGCLESEAGSQGIVRRALAHLAAGEPSALQGQPALTVDAVLGAARAGDPLAQTVVRETVDYLALAIANLACIVDPERIIITGELAEFGDLFLEPIRARIAGLVPATPDIVLSDLRMDATVLGAVAIVMRETSDSLFVQPSRA
jgi:predicted NBD/HSP70 family sugar kinase